MSTGPSVVDMLVETKAAVVKIVEVRVPVIEIKRRPRQKRTSHYRIKK